MYTCFGPRFNNGGQDGQTLTEIVEKSASLTYFPQMKMAGPFYWFRRNEANDPASIASIPGEHFKFPALKGAGWQVRSGVPALIDAMLPAMRARRERACLMNKKQKNFEANPPRLLVFRFSFNGSERSLGELKSLMGNLNGDLQGSPAVLICNLKLGEKPEPLPCVIYQTP